MKKLLFYALCFMLVEAFARILLPTPQEVEILRDVSRFEIKSIPDEGSYLGLYVETAQGRRLRPNTRATINNHFLNNNTIVLQINSIGTRGPEPRENANPRILFLGDSITIADSVDDSLTFVRNVEKLLSKQAPQVEAINAGIGAAGLRDYKYRLVELSKLNSDITVIGVYLNDYRSSPVFFPLRLPFLLRYSHAAHYLALGFSLWLRPPSLDPSDSAILDKIELLKEEARINLADEIGSFHLQETEEIMKAIHDWGGAWSNEAWKIFHREIEEIIALAAKQKTKLLFVFFPVRMQVESQILLNLPQRRFLEFCQQKQLLCLDLLPVLRRASKSGESLFFDHCHLAPKGNILVANEVVNWIAIPQSAKQEESPT